MQPVVVRRPNRNSRSAHRWTVFTFVATSLSLVGLVEYMKYQRRDCMLTSSGWIQATRVVSRSGTTVRLYRAVPFGQTTSGRNRFARPLPIDFVSSEQCPSVGPSHAGPPCKQWRRGGQVVGSEDCLNMNVWAPADAFGNRRTVVVVVMGEWFQSEYNTDSNWANLAAAGDFVVAAPNHRVGAFGFLNAGVGGVHGNAAIEDLLLAVSWLQKNARKFHGDPEDIVALGLGSGAFLLSVILMSPEFNVFRRAFLQGPYPTSPTPLNTPAHGQVYMSEMARHLGCSEGDIFTEMECLRSATEDGVLKSSKNVTAEMAFVPSSFYGVDLTQLHKRAALGEVELMLGSDGIDARTLFRHMVPLDYFYGNGLSEIDAFVYFMAAMKGVVAEVVPPRYLPRGLIDAASIMDVEDYIANLWTSCFPRIIADEAASKNGTVYRYLTTKRRGRPLRAAFDMDVIAGFLKNGTVPQLMDNETWLPYEAGRRFTVNATKRGELVEAAAVDCSDMDEIVRLLQLHSA